MTTMSWKFFKFCVNLKKDAEDGRKRDNHENKNYNKNYTFPVCFRVRKKTYN